jgi:hypothetical protein
MLSSLSFPVFLSAIVFTTNTFAQTVAPPSQPSPEARVVAMSVPDGTPLQIALDKEVRVRKVGEPITGRVMQPVYVFDHLVIPVGTTATGRISAIAPVPGGTRALSALNADFTPSRKLFVTFDELILPDGHHVDLHATIVPGSGQVIRLVSADEHKKNVGKYAVARLPVHPQYIDAGTLYTAELSQPLDFGNESVSADALSAIGTSPPPGSLVHAILLTPLNSATTLKNADVEAELSQPLIDQGCLILPAGTRLRGTVLQVQPARRLHRNGQLRISFREVILPNGTV